MTSELQQQQQDTQHGDTATERVTREHEALVLRLCQLV